MKFVCDKCGAQYKIKDEKIGPNGVSVRCKKCDHKIIVRLPKKEQPAPEFPDFPAGDGAISSDLEATRQMANPLLALQAAEEEEKRQAEAEAAAKAAKAAAEKKKASGQASDEWGTAPESASSGESGSSVSSLQFDLGLAKDEALGKALDNVLGGPEGGSDDSPFASVPGGFDSSGGADSAPDDGNATRVVNLAAMASLMKTPETKAAEPSDGASGASASPAASSEAPAAPDIPPGEEWFVAINGQQHGPMDFEGVKAHWERGELSTDSLVWNPSMADWAALGTVPELSKRLEPPKPAMSDIPKPALDGNGAGPLDEWGLPVSSSGSPSSVPSAASLPSPQDAPSDAPAWKPAAASMLSSLLQDEMSALEAQPAASPSAPVSQEPQAQAAALPAMISSAPAPASAGVLPNLAPLPRPSSLPAPAAAEETSSPLIPPAAAEPGAFDGLNGLDNLPPPPPPISQDLNAPLPGIGVDAEDSNRDSTVPGGFAGGSDAGLGSWEIPAASAVPASLHQNRNRGGRPKQGGGSRRQEAKSHAMPPPQQLPQMPSRISGTVKGAIVLGVLVLLILAALFLLKATSSGNEPQPPVPEALQAQTPNQTQPESPAAPAAPETSAAAAPAVAAASASSPTPAAAAPAPAVPAAPEAVAAAPAAQASDQKDVAPPPSKYASASEKKTASKKKKKKKSSRSKVKSPSRASRIDDEEDDEFEEDDEDETPVAAAAAPAPAPAAPPPPPPQKAEPASKVDDDFERLFGGGSSSASSAPSPAPAPAKKPTVYVPPPTGTAAKASLTQSDIMSEVIKHRSAIKRCTDEEDDSGTIVMAWVIQKSGKPSDIKTATADYKGSDLENCLKKVIGSMSFPPYSGAQMQPIRFPFKF